MIEAMFTMLKRCPGRWRRTVALAHKMTPVMLTSSTFCQADKSRSTEGSRMAMPALLTTPATGPRASMASRACSTDVSVLTSSATARPRPPAAVMSAAVSSARARSRSAIAAIPPAAATVRETARPIPPPPPVMSTTSLFKRNASRGALGSGADSWVRGIARLPVSYQPRSYGSLAAARQRGYSQPE